MTVHVCPIKDIVCGDRPSNWCDECPLNKKRKKNLTERFLTFPLRVKTDPAWVANLRNELMMSKASHNFTFTRDEVMEMLAAPPVSRDYGIERAIAFFEGLPWDIPRFSKGEIVDNLRRLQGHPAAPQDGWMPIETAPKDGSRVILGRPETEDDIGVSTTGFWIEAEEDGVDYMGADAGFVDIEYQVFSPGRSFGNPARRYEATQPTCWQEIPAPPTKE